MGQNSHYVQAVVAVQSLSLVGLFARLFCPRPSPGICSNSCPLSLLLHLFLLLPSSLLPSIFHSIRVFSNELGLHIRWPKYRTFSFSISPANEYSGLISFRIDWFDLAVQGISRVFPSTTVWKHQLLCAQLSLWSNSYIPTWLLEKP